MILIVGGLLFGYVAEPAELQRRTAVVMLLLPAG
jgi:hypothetical protein